MRTLIFLFISLLVTGARAGELALEPRLTHELDLVLKAGDSLHRSLIGQNEEQVDLSLRDVVIQLDHARVASQLAKPHERRHLLRILDSAREQFELTQTTFGEERRVRLEDAFNQLVNLVRIYKVNRQFAIFFCPKDKTTWVQKGAKGLNPFHPDNHREPCGLRVSK